MNRVISGKLVKETLCNKEGWKSKPLVIYNNRFMLPRYRSGSGTHFHVNAIHCILETQMTSFVIAMEFQDLKSVYYSGFLKSKSMGHGFHEYCCVHHYIFWFVGFGLRCLETS